MTRDRPAAKARNVDELATALRSISNQHPELAGNLLGSWNLPSLYLDAWEDANAGSSTAYALHQPLDIRTLDSLKKFSSLCQSSGVNPCLDGTYDDDQQPTLAADKFARGEADALFGYSERLFFVLSIASDDLAILITPAPMGNGKYPALFTDAFVLRRGAPANVEEAARLFVEFMTSQRIQEVIMTSGDVSAQAVPRYLIPATLSAFDAPRLRNDRLFQALRSSISNAVPFPNVGFLNTRKAIRDEVKSALEKP
jgi:thiamine pyridinylase